MNGVRVLLVDTSVPGSKGSMARYAQLVEQALRNQGETSGDLKFEHICLRAPSALDGLPSQRLRTWIYHSWLLLLGPFQLRRREADLIHILDGSYGYLGSPALRLPTVITIHDLIPILRQKGKFGPVSDNRISRWLSKRVVEGWYRAAWLLSVSANTATDLQEHLGATANRISVSPLALPSGIRLASSSNRPAAKDLSQSRYLLHVGNNGFYKNREGVIRIFSRVRAGRDVRLVMAGPKPSEALKGLIGGLGLQAHIEFVIDPDDEALAQLYQGAAVFLFPSLYEGFGWPPLEAMACGCPVVCSSEGSLPEVVGDAALTAPAMDEDGLAAHCLAILSDTGLATSLVERGRAWVQRYTVERMRRDLLEAYRNALNDRPCLRK